MILQLLFLWLLRLGNESKRLSSSSSSSSDDSSDGEDSSEDDTFDRRVDYSRGEVMMESSSSDESDSEGNEEVDVEHGWGELDTEANRSEEVSSRLAICNMDWDRITAKDILVLLSSFKPPGGFIKSVKVIPLLPSLSQSYIFFIMMWCLICSLYFTRIIHPFRKYKD